MSIVWDQQEMGEPEEQSRPLDYYAGERQDKHWRREHKALLVGVWGAAVVFCLGVWALVIRWLW